MTTDSETHELTAIERARLVLASGAWFGRSPAHWERGGTGTYEEAVGALRSAVSACRPLDTSHGDTTDMWTRGRRAVRQHLLSRDPATFLTWTPLVERMTFGFLPWISTEFRALRHSSRWHEQWEGALRENRAGLPMPSHVFPASSGTLIHHAYHLHRFEYATGRSITSYPEIVEFGGGYGSMARLVARLGFRGRYHIHDLPEFLALQQFYLRAVRAEVGPGDLAEALAEVSHSDEQDAALPSDASNGDALFLATWSLGETPLSLRDEWRPTLDRFRHFLIGFHDQFEDIDNRSWFKDFAASRPDISWRFEPVAHRAREGTLQYLFGVPADDEAAPVAPERATELS